MDTECQRDAGFLENIQYFHLKDKHALCSIGLIINYGWDRPAKPKMLKVNERGHS